MFIEFASLMVFSTEGLPQNMIDLRKFCERVWRRKNTIFMFEKCDKIMTWGGFWNIIEETTQSFEASVDRTNFHYGILGLRNGYCLHGGLVDIL